MFRICQLIVLIEIVADELLVVNRFLVVNLVVTFLVIVGYFNIFCPSCSN